jgi:hypothetical protein
VGVGVGVGDARASRAERFWRSAVVVVCWDSGGIRHSKIRGAVIADGCGEAAIDEISIAVVGFLYTCQF